MSEIGTELFQRTMKWADENNDKLMQQVWENTPWMVNAYTGSIANHGRYWEIMNWCRKHFGPESWPFHGDLGKWRCGGATIHGKTWMGFATEELMNEFCAAWPDPQEGEADG